ncbi:MAG: hypothetical protein Q7R85_02310 [bacterium]|nr:hypothetical protein [bacterium]
MTYINKAKKQESKEAKKQKNKKARKQGSKELQAQTRGAYTAPFWFMRFYGRVL